MRPSISPPIQTGHESERAERLLARVPEIRNACDLDLLVFLYRHPRTLLTNEQLARFAGYDMKEIARTLEVFVDAGLLERTAQPSAHAARMYLLVLNGPNGGGRQALLDMACTRLGRRQILDLLNKCESAKTNRTQEMHQTKVVELRPSESA